MKPGTSQRGSLSHGKRFYTVLTLSDRLVGETGAETVMVRATPGPGQLISAHLCPLLKHETHQNPEYTLYGVGGH